MKRSLLCLGLLLVGAAGLSFAQSRPPAAERGREALLGRAFVPGLLPRQRYDNLWRQWGSPEKPADYEQALRDRYGLHQAPYDNKGLPMGLRESSGPLGKGIASDCMLCHAGAVAGKSYVGLGNSALDLQTLFEDFSAAAGFPSTMSFPLTHVRGTSEAAALSAYLLSLRDADLNLRTAVKLEYRTDLCEDVPAWWLLKKKQTMYHTGSTDARAVRSLMQFMLSPLNSRAYIKQHEATFADLRAYLLTLEPPRYPWPVDEPLAARGKGLFVQHCARCHGTYGADWSYPNKIVPLAEIGTDPSLVRGFSAGVAEHYNKSWFAQEKGPDGKPYHAVDRGGYQAPPLDGIWATAPYFHNGSVPTVYHVLNSKARPRIFTRSFRTGAEEYDRDKLGWKVTELDRAPEARLPAIERRKVYDTTQPGRGNGGHTYGDDLTEQDRKAVLEYLKTL